MMQLREEVLELRGETFRVRELSAKRKAQWGALVSADKYAAQYSLVSLVCVDPAMSVEQWQEMPSEVVDRLADCGLRLSGMDDRTSEKKD